MVDPFGVTGGIGLGLGVLSFLSSTVSTIIRQGSEAKGCNPRLKAYRHQLQSCQRKLEIWKSIWYQDQGLPKEGYTYYWGVDGYRDIKDQLQTIIELISSIKRHLKLVEDGGKRVKSLSDPQLQDWEGLIRQLEHNPRHQPSSRGYIGKIAFAIAENSMLAEELSRLTNLTEDFVSCCVSTLRLKQGVQTDKAVSTEEIAHLEDIRILSEGLSKFAVDLHAARSSYEWGLELRVPDCDGDAAQIDNPASISMDFLVQGWCVCKRWKGARFRVHYYTSHCIKSNHTPKHIGQEMLGVLKDCTAMAKSQSDVQQFIVSEDPRRTDRPVRQLIAEENGCPASRKASQQERLVAAVGLVNWVCLLWKTPWTANPCLCKIYSTELQHTRGPYVLQSSCRTHIGPHCLTADDFNDGKKLFLLGRVLAELVSAKPLGIIQDQKGQLCFVKDGETATKEQLLQDLSRDIRPRGNGILQAIRYCLLTKDWGPDEREERIREHATNIIQP